MSKNVKIYIDCEKTKKTFYSFKYKNNKDNDNQVYRL